MSGGRRGKTSLVWRFFDKSLDANNKVEDVICKLCDQSQRFFGNTTNMRGHMLRKHPIQWDLLTSDNAEEATRTRKIPKNVRYSVSVDNNDIITETNDGMPRIVIERVNTTTDIEDDEDEDSRAAIRLVKSMHGKGSDEEWLEEDPFQTSNMETYITRPKKKKMIKIKREKQSPPRRLSSYMPSTVEYEYETPRPLKEYKNPSQDEFSVFGEYIASKLRNFKQPKTRGNLQQLITTILWQAEYGLYDNAEAVKKVLLMSTDSATVTQQQQTVEIELQAQENYE